MAGAVTFALAKEDAGADLSAVKSYEVSQEHVTTPVNYEQEPPVGGEHNPVWLNCGTYPDPVPNENATHSLEHGAVWITYRPDLAKGDVEDLEQSVPSTYTIVSPFPGLESPVVASAWGKQVALKGVDDPRLDAFIREYRQGPQTPEMGAACTGGSDGTLPLDVGGTSQQ